MPFIKAKYRKLRLNILCKYLLVCTYNIYIFYRNFIPKHATQLFEFRFVATKS